MAEKSTPTRRRHSELVTPEKAKNRHRGALFTGESSEDESVSADELPSEDDKVYEPPRRTAQAGSRFLVGYPHEIQRDAPRGYFFDPLADEYYIRRGTDATPFATWLPRQSPSAAVGVFFLDVPFGMKDEAKRHVRRVKTRVCLLHLCGVIVLLLLCRVPNGTSEAKSGMPHLSLMLLRAL